MKRGIVMSIHKHHTVVMTADGQFLRAPVTGSTRIGEEITFEDEYKQPRSFRGAYRYISAAAIVLLFMLPLLLYIGRDAEPVVAYLSMDINPSIEIGVDSQEKTRELRALNAEGEKLIAGLPYEGLYVQDVAAAIVERAQLDHYFDMSVTDVFIASVLMGEQTEALQQFESLLTKKVDETVKTMLSGYAGAGQGISVTTLSVPFEVRSAADANGISSGKMTVYLMAKEEGYALELEQLKNQSLEEATEALGGVKAIVKQADAQNKEKLKQLAAEEVKKQEQQVKQQPAASQAATKQAPAKQAIDKGKTEKIKEENKETRLKKEKRQNQEKQQKSNKERFQEGEKEKQKEKRHSSDGAKQENRKAEKEKQKKEKEEKKREQTKRNKNNNESDRKGWNRDNNERGNQNRATTETKSEVTPVSHASGDSSSKSDKEKDGSRSKSGRDDESGKEQKQEQDRSGKKQANGKQDQQR